jgi:hypothetical protein
MKAISSIDLMIASVMFLIGITFFVQIVMHVMTSYEKDVDQGVRASIAESILNILFKSEGVPRDWHASDVIQLGLCENYTNICRVSQEKLTELSTMNYGTVHELLRIKDYDFRISLKNMSNNFIFDYNATTVGRTMIALEDVSLLDDKQVRAIVQVW